MLLADGREVDVHVAVPGARYNVYDCPDGHPILSMDLDEGVTPFLTTCPDHHVHATSRFYPRNLPVSLFPVRLIWRKATPGERKRERRDGGNHYAQGGLAREVVPTMKDMLRMFSSDAYGSPAGEHGPETRQQRRSRERSEAKRAAR